MKASDLFAEMLAALEPDAPSAPFDALQTLPTLPPGPTPKALYVQSGRLAVATVGDCPRCREGRGWLPVLVEQPELYGPGRHSTALNPTCECMAERDHARRYTAAQVPAGLAGRSLDSFVVEGPGEPKDGRGRAVDVCTQFLRALQAGRRPSGLLLAGKPGRGKSHLLAAIVRAVTWSPLAEALKAIAPVSVVTGSTTQLVRWVSASSFGDEVSRAMASKGAELANLKEALLDVPLLVVDELGDGDPGRMGGQVLGEILRLRRDAALPICAATNYLPTPAVEGEGEGEGSLSGRLPLHLASRLLTLPTASLVGADFRAKEVA